MRHQLRSDDSPIRRPPTPRYLAALQFGEDLIAALAPTNLLKHPRKGGIRLPEYLFQLDRLGDAFLPRFALEAQRG
jgi:hypothetical protein